MACNCNKASNLVYRIMRSDGTVSSDEFPTRSAAQRSMSKGERVIAGLTAAPDGSGTDANPGARSLPSSRDLSRIVPR